MGNPPSNRLLTLLLMLSVLLTAFPLVIDLKILHYFFGGIVMVPFLMFHAFSYLIGTALCCVTIGLFLLRRERLLVPPALLVPLLGDLNVFAQAFPFLAVPAGSVIRPMGWAFFTFFIA